MEPNLPIEHELKITPSSSIQVKLLSSLQTQNLDELIKTLKGVLGVGDFVLTAENVKNTTDDYYDTSSLSLFHCHSLLRVRREGGLPTVVVKTLIGQAQGELKRTEFEHTTSEEELQSLVATGFSAIVNAQLPDFKSHPLRHNLEVSKTRRNYIMARGAERYRLSLDAFSFANPKTGRASEKLFEIEIESLNAEASEKLRGIKHNLLDVLNGFAFSNGSKYERGIKAFHIDGAAWKQTLSKWNTGIGLNWVGVVIGVLSLLVGVVGTWLTIRAT
jgi:inorganic triphosphatase YgiF